MRVPGGAIDCDIHPSVPGTTALLPYLDEFWREQIVSRHIHRAPFTPMSYPPSSPANARSDWRLASGGPPGSDIERVRAQALDAFGTRIAICNVLHGAPALFNEDLSAALCSAVNDWVAREILDRDPRFRASILIPSGNPELAVAEIDRVAGDKRFVQVLVFAMGEMLLGRRVLWPIYRAAERHGLVIGIHAGSLYRHPPTASGWTSYQVEDYVTQSSAFQSQVLSLVAEGVFSTFPNLKVVCMESGFTWLPSLLWRSSKTWRGARTEVPWVDRSPADIIRDHVRFTLQPTDVPNSEQLTRTIDHIGTDEVLLFSTDYPHWHFEGEDAIPDGLSPETVSKLAFENALATYPRLRAATESTTSLNRSETVP